MKTIKNYNDFILEGKQNNYVIDYIYDRITEEEFNNYAFSEFINEGIIDSIKNIAASIKEKFINIIFNFIIEAKKLGDKILPKILNFSGKWIGYLKNFKEKHPTLVKVIIVLIIMAILFAVSSQSAHAGDLVHQHIKLDNSDVSKLAIAWITEHSKTIQQAYPDAGSVIEQTQTYLKHLGDPSFDTSQINSEAIKCGDAAVSIIKRALEHTDNPGAKEILTNVTKFLGVNNSLADFIKSAVAK